MKMGIARALLLAAGAITSCGKGGGAVMMNDAGSGAETNLVASWTLAGEAAAADTCMAHGAAQIYLNLSGTIDPDLHETTTVDCSLGKATFNALAIDKLGEPYLEGTLLDAKGTALALVGVNVMPVTGDTNVSLDFFTAQGTGGGTTASSSSSASTTHASTSTASSSGSASTASGSTGTASSSGSAATTSGSTSTASSSAASTSSSTSTSSSSGNPDAGDGG